jgi:hypothetical protein
MTDKLPSNADINPAGIMITAADFRAEIARSYYSGVRDGVTRYAYTVLDESRKRVQVVGEKRYLLSAALAKIDREFSVKRNNAATSVGGFTGRSVEQADPMNPSSPREPQQRRR